MYDIVIWGATGCTGLRAARYLHAQHDGRLKWAIAGRDRARLEAVRARIGAPELPVLVVPGGDATAADALARATRVVCATVAPAAEHAGPMVEACVRHGTDYCDLSGELHWIRAMIDRHDAAARASGARVLNACGFDSIPSDLGVQFLQQEALRTFGEPCTTIVNAFEHGHIAVSGGSFASGLGVMRAIARDPALAPLIADPNSLNPRDRMQGTATPELDRVVFDADFGQFVAPFPLGGINTRIVRRSHALAGFPWGEGFEYRELKLAGRGLTARLRAQAELAGYRLFMGGNPDALPARLLQRLGPRPGDGPTEAQSARYGPFSFRMLGRTRDGRTLRATIHCPLDPGHGGTAAMLCETAYCLAMERARTGHAGGFTTTAVALGEVLRERLAEHAELRFSLEQAP